MTEIFLYSNNHGKFVYTASTFIDKCQSSDDLFFDTKPDSGSVNIFHCPVVDKDARYSGTMCLGPTDKSVCEFNTAT